VHWNFFAGVLLQRQISFSNKNSSQQFDAEISENVEFLEFKIADI